MSALRHESPDASASASMRREVPRAVSILVTAAIGLAACSSPPPTTIATASVTPRDTATTAVSSPTTVPPTTGPSVTPSPTEPPPPSFRASGLLAGIEPTGYVDDACEALRKRWDPAGSPPGTVVVPIMYHTIREPSNMPSDSVTVSTDMFHATVDLARSLGFETITSAELLAFLRDNARIPERSMLLIVDDRYPGSVGTYMLPVAEAFDWTLTLGWIIGNTGPNLWATIEGLASGGRLDVQSHGLRHQYILPEMSDEEIREEIAGPIPILEEHFGYRPIAFVWPGGNFTRRSVEIAREEGYELAFTIHSRGPLLFNGIPLGDEERAVDDPLMVLPRAWSTAATFNLRQADEIGAQAARFAAENREAEAEWYRQTCGDVLPSP